MNHHHTAAQHQSDAVAALISGALTNPHQPGEPTPEAAREAITWLATEDAPAADWEVDTTHPTVATITGRIRRSTAEERREAMQQWSAVIGSRSIGTRGDRLDIVGRYQGFSVSLVATP